MTIIINTQTDAEKLCKNDNYNNRVIKLDDDLEINCDLTLTDVTIDCEYHENAQIFENARWVDAG